MSPDLEQFVKDLEEQRLRYEKMVEVTVEQNRLISSSELDALLNVLKKKTQLLLEIDEIERRTAPLRKSWNESREQVDPETAKRVEEAVAGTKEVLQKLLKLEEEGRSMMEERKGATGGKIRDLQQKKKVRDAYGKSGTKKPPGESRFFDQNK